MFRGCHNLYKTHATSLNSLANVLPLQDNNGAPVTIDPTTGMSQVYV